MLISRLCLLESLPCLRCVLIHISLVGKAFPHSRSSAQDRKSGALCWTEFSWVTTISCKGRCSLLSFVGWPWKRVLLWILEQVHLFPQSVTYKHLIPVIHHIPSHSKEHNLNSYPAAAELTAAGTINTCCLYSGICSAEAHRATSCFLLSSLVSFVIWDVLHVLHSMAEVAMALETRHFCYFSETLLQNVDCWKLGASGETWMSSDISFWKRDVLNLLASVAEEISKHSENF